VAKKSMERLVVLAFPQNFDNISYDIRRGEIICVISVEELKKKLIQYGFAQ
jgi:hypothetical protein